MSFNFHPMKNFNNTIAHSVGLNKGLCPLGWLALWPRHALVVGRYAMCSRLLTHALGIHPLHGSVSPLPFATARSMTLDWNVLGWTAWLPWVQHDCLKWRNLAFRRFQSCPAGSGTCSDGSSQVISLLYNWQSAHLHKRRWHRILDS